MARHPVASEQPSSAEAILLDPLRLRAIHRSGLVDTVANTRLDELTELVAELLDVPQSIVTIVTADRQHFASAHGVGEPWKSQRGTPVERSLCQYVVASGREMAIEDTRVHPVVQRNPAVTDGSVAAYAGVPVTSPDGSVLGTFCVADSNPRAWTDRDLRVLRAFARTVSEHVALHEASREAQSRLRELESSYREVVDTLDEVVFALDRDGRWTWLSPAWLAVTGYTVEESIGRTFEELVYPEDRAANDAAFGALMSGVSVDYRHLMRCVRADGTVRWLGARARAVRDANGRIVGALGALNDVTARVTAERALRERDDELARSRKLEAVGRLAAGIAHDFNNVLAAVSGHAQFLREDAQDLAAEDVEAIIDAVKRGESLARQLLAVSSRLPSMPAPVDVNDVVRGMSRMLGRVLADDIRVLQHLADDLPQACADRSQLEQVLLNLLVNARDAMPKGGTVTIETERVRLRDGRDAVCLSVQDTGTGMDAETLARLFEPFFTTKPVGQGTGLGLATVHGIVHQWGGRVDVESTPGEGSRFRVSIPADGGKR